MSDNIPNGWVETVLEEIADIEMGQSPKSEFYNFEAIGLPFYQGVTEFNDKYVSVKKYTSQSTKIVKENTILFSVRAPVGRVNFTKNKCCIGRGNAGLFMKNNNQDFLYFLLKYIERKIQDYSSGTVFTAISGKELKTIPIVIPVNNDEQKAIAKILTAFDDKIELLQAQNKTLETTAQTIFKEWFGKYQIGDELPEGWRMYQMSELVNTINGYSYKGKELVEESNEALVTLKSFDRNGGFQTRGFKPFKGTPKPTQEVQIGDLVVAHTDLTQDAEVLGNPAFIFDNGGFDKMYITMDLVKVVSKYQDISSSFLYYLMKDRAFKGHCVGYSNGTTVLHLSKKAIPEYQVYLPSDFELIKQFSSLADATTNKISLNKEEIKSLKQTRDTLLPKLMSGQLRVDEFKESAV